MFISPKITLNEKIAITKNTLVNIPECDYKKYLLSCMDSLIKEPTDKIECTSVDFILGISDDIKAKIEKASEYKNDPEEYALSLGERITVYASTPTGFLRAASTLMQMDSDGGIDMGFIYDYPACPIRGYRVYMPGRETFEEFKRMIDFIVYYKYNSIVLEVGGAMEYKRHPKINEKWI